jgi:hypothetical protein
MKTTVQMSVSWQRLSFLMPYFFHIFEERNTRMQRLKEICKMTKRR